MAMMSGEVSLLEYPSYCADYSRQRFSSSSVARCLNPGNFPRTRSKARLCYFTTQEASCYASFIR